MGKFKSKPFYYLLSGDYALFTTPITKGGGEKYTYPIPTYQAIKAITEAIYWKPTFIIYIDEIKVLNKISTETKGIRLLYGRGKENSIDRSKYTYLKDVKYAIKYHFEWNTIREDFIFDRNEKKHTEIMLRSLKKGGRRDIFLGVRECIGYVKYLSEEEYDTIVGEYNNTTISFGIMFHSFNYPTEGTLNDYDGLQSNFTDITMINGKVNFCRPKECPINMNLSKLNIKELTPNNVKAVDQEYQEIIADNGLGG